MKNFFAALLGTITGIILTLVILVLIIVGIVASMGDKTVVTIKPNSVLHLTLNNPIVDRADINPFENFNFSSFKANKSTGLKDLLDNIKKAKTDDNIKGIYLDISFIPTGIATVEEVRNALIDFKKSGKFIVSYSEFYTQKSYYLATVSDSIFMNPEGLIPLYGFCAQNMFFKGTLEKLGIKPVIFRHGSFKSAVEPFILNKMSDENKLQMSTFINSIWDILLKGVSETRHIDIQKLKTIADSLLINEPVDAVNYKLIDRLTYKDQVLASLKNYLKLNIKDDLNFVSLEKYMSVADDTKKKKLEKNKIAVIYATGEIHGGESSNDDIGSESLSATIREARLDTSIKAIVLRVNSPGGSSIASDVIWRELVLARKVKPVIASMGDIAGSGGYYIVCAANTIVASPNTLTGSIGVFGMFFNVEELFNNKLGITMDVVKTNTYSDIGSPFRDVSPYEKRMVEREIDRIYYEFISKVAEGRGLTKEQVDSIAQGRIWSGVDAKKIGLVDVLGGIDSAISIAARAAKLKDYRIVSLPKQENPFEKMAKELTGDAETKMAKNKLGTYYKYYENIQDLVNARGIQKRMPFNVEIN